MATTRRTTKATGRRATNTGARKATNKPAARKAAPAKATTERDVTVYADKAPTDYHKWFARWIVQEVGYDPETAPSLKAAFLRGVSIATAARPAFMDSAFLEEMREKTGTAKRGPKPKEEAETTRRKTRQVVSDDEFEDDDEEIDEEEIDEDDDVDEDDEEFDDEEDDSEEDDSDEDDDEDFEDDEEEEEAPRARRAPAKKTTAKRAPAKKAAPARRTTKKDDDFLF